MATDDTTTDQGRTISSAPRRRSGLWRIVALVCPLLLGLLWFGLSTGLALAQDVSISLGQGSTLTERAVQLVGLLTVLSLAPSIVVMMTSFTRIVVVLSLLRSAIGLQSAPPNAVMVSLALFLTAFIMAPTFQDAYTNGIEPVVNNQIDLTEGFTRTMQPMRAFMLAHTREVDLRLFVDLANQPQPESQADLETRIIIPAFMISELRRAFEIGFLIYLPFLIIDMVVSSILMAMGMMMLPPVVVSLPFKLIFFVLVDGWALLAGSLVRSYAT
ncbi:flagellar type III secretion system pore protein FliP [Pleomorphomonas koreensis]|uniref:flagellar type III secretion system pore protein FliP n=1 Tax=Pleomorphomonas koreensis TaxID=257440 RepID=UPI0004295EAC|nr:flagellar type III secretion system pore protein FliP [Pleomorphomonas koreensis]